MTFELTCDWTLLIDNNRKIIKIDGRNTIIGWYVRYYRVITSFMAALLRPSSFTFILFFSIFALMACRQEVVEEPFHPTEDHSSYVEALDKLNLLDAALGQDWLRSSHAALTDPLDVNLPFREDFYLSPSGTTGYGYRFDMEQGQRLEIKIETVKLDSGILFMDVFRLKDDGNLIHVASRAKNAKTIEFEIIKEATYILRIQPELLRGGKYELSIMKSPSLAFPVLGKNRSAVLSFFGDPRDGGKRKHHGVDIFASRHTPIIAPTGGTIRFAGERGLGGRVVWMYDNLRDQTLYFAHLQDIMVHKGEQIFPGDTLGTVGNSGNARTTPPHLHFGIYKSGPQDPFPYIADVNKKPKKIWGKASYLGRWMRTSRPSTLLDTNSDLKSGLKKHQVLLLEAASSYSYRVSLPDGRKGYVKHTDLEDLIKPIVLRDLSSPLAMLDRPGISATDIKQLDTGVAIKIHGYHEEYL